MAGARPLFAEALALFKATGAERGVANVALNLDEAEFRGGDASAALRLAGEALAGFRAFKATRLAAATLTNMAAYLVTLGRYEEAFAHARDALGPMRDAQDAPMIAHTLQHFAAVLALPGGGGAPDFTRAARLLGYVDSRLTALDAGREYTEQQEYDKVLAALRDALGADKLAKLMEEGGVWSEDEAVTQALLV